MTFDGAEPAIELWLEPGEVASLAGGSWSCVGRPPISFWRPCRAPGIPPSRWR